eukprot:4459504-Alexandrium_andersonii.AAC.1
MVGRPSTPEAGLVLTVYTSVNRTLAKSVHSIGLELVLIGTSMSVDFLETKDKQSRSSRQN